VKKSLILTLTLTLTLVATAPAYAFQSTLRCVAEGNDGASIESLQIDVPGVDAAAAVLPQSDVPVMVTAKNIRVGTKTYDRMNLAGYAGSAASGVYYILQNPASDLRLLISAPASHTNSQISVNGGELYKTNCASL
jgi:hypothetical protein